jgi:hypothetical protein
MPSSVSQYGVALLMKLSDSGALHAAALSNERVHRWHALACPYIAPSALQLRQAPKWSGSSTARLFVTMTPACASAAAPLQRVRPVGTVRLVLEVVAG